jgi:flavin-binding protein dodecin
VLHPTPLAVYIPISPLRLLEASDMADPFRSAPATPTGLGRVLRSKRVTTFEALEDLLACSEKIRAVRAEDVRAICAAAAVDLKRKFMGDRKDLYRRYLAHCLDDKVITEEESADLQHLANLLHLDDRDIAPIHDDLAQEMYGMAIREVLEDLRLDPDEEAFLRRLQGDLQLSDDVARRLYERGESQARDRAYSKAATGDKEFVEFRPPAGEFTGRSTSSLEGAVADALTKASVAVPKLHWFELTNISGYVENGRPKSWHVSVRAGIKPGS